MRSISLKGFSRLRRLSVLLSLSALACCAHDAVLAFHVEPPLLCPNQTVAITWKVRGRAQLKANPTPPGWKEDVPSDGGLPAVTVGQDTTFTILAPDANQARGSSFASQEARVTAQTDNRAVQAMCDASGTCSGTLTIDADKSVRVKRMANPTWRSGFKVADHEVCVTPPSGSRTCLAPNTSAALDLPASGVWKFDMKLAQTELGDPPPELRVFFDFGCK